MSVSISVFDRGIEFTVNVKGFLCGVLALFVEYKVHPNLESGWGGK